MACAIPVYRLLMRHPVCLLSDMGGLGNWLMGTIIQLGVNQEQDEGWKAEYKKPGKSG
jgi:hypothetical protein